MAVVRPLPSCLVVLIAACSGAPATPATTPAPVTSGAPSVEDLGAAVFEVVVPKYEAAGMQYAEALPLHLLPHHERTDAYYSIGTAFTLDGRTFISAAHVFLLWGQTQFGERRLRGTDGSIHEIDQFVHHSGVRDLIAFTLRDRPATIAPLRRGPRPAVGAQVYTVGSALGEGLSVRGGNVASFTPEPLEGAWDFVRYSAPASPGNSGGPLLDGEGQVVGVVVRKSSDENLNYAVPIEELDNLSASRGDFYSRLGEHEAGQRLVADWRVEVDLPAGYAALASRGQAAYYGAQLDHRAAFERKFAAKIFPTDPELRSYLREQATYYYPAEIDRDPSGRWAAQEATNASAHEVGPEQTMYIGQTAGRFYVALERPDDVPLATFVTEPQRVADALLHTLNITRDVGGANIRITTYGPAHHHKSWRDELGRPWTSTTWRLIGDKSSTLHCTPYPRGLACMLDETATAGEPLHVPYARINARRWTLSYDGRIKDWREYLALDPALRPRFLDGTVALTGSQLVVDLGAIHLAPSHADLSAESLLTAAVAYASVTPPALHVTGLAVATTKTRGVSLRVDRVVQPLASGQQSWRDYWDELIAGRAPYDGKVVRDGETAQLIIVQPAPAVAMTPDSSVEARALVSCWTGDNVAVPDAALTKVCAAFRKGLAVGAD